MSRETMDDVLAYIDSNSLERSIKVLDLTGGAPEMNPDFCYLVEEAGRRGIHVIDRCNLTILQEPGYEHMAQFLADHQVTVVASLPCYAEQNVNEQRGKGVYQESIDALHRLNSLGYGRDETLQLDLVYNPNGAFLPPSQEVLEADYKRTLLNEHDIVFNQLLTITNMPISRFGSMLLSKGLYDGYIQLLKDNFSNDNLQSVMCKSLLSIDWQGFVYDCDFNQMLQMPIEHASHHIASDKQRTHVKELFGADLVGKSIVIGEHCYGCTAGQGSSCGGALA